MGIVDQITANETKILSLSDIPKSCLEKGQKIDAFIQALEGNTSITTVRLQGDFLACVRADMRSKMVKAVGELANVREVYFGNSLLLVPDLTALLQAATSLTVFHLDDVCLQGPPEYFDDFEKALRTHSALKSFDMKNCMSANQSIDMEKIQNATESDSKPAALPATATACPGTVNPAASA